MQLVLGSGVEAEVALHEAVPGIVVASVQADPFLICHAAAPLEKRSGVGPHGMTELPCSALKDFQYLLRHQGGWRGIFQRGLKREAKRSRCR